MLNFLKKISLNQKILIFLIFYCIFRILIININNSEWGDSYRILRATDFLEIGTYPEDEKRPPFFSYLLSFNFVSDYILSSRIWMLIISLLTVWLFYLVLKEVLPNIDDKLKIFAVMFFALNPLFLYWSIRIYADTLFLLFSLVSIYIYYKYLNTNKYLYLLIIPFILNISILTRFEGYLLLASTFGAAFFQFKNIQSRLILYSLTSILFLFIISNPETFYYQNPLTSSYVDEAVSREIGVNEVLNFISQLFFILGSILSVYLFAFSVRDNLVFLRNNLIISFLLFLQLALAAYWFAAVPRLFLTAVPFLIFLFVVSLNKFIKTYSGDLNLKNIKKFISKDKFGIIIPLLLVSFYLLSQFNLRLPFLLNKKTYIFTIVAVSLLALFLLLRRKFSAFMLVSVILSASWGIMFISLEKDVFKVLNKAVMFLSSEKNPEDIVLTNDVSGMTRYYLKDSLKFSNRLNSGSNPIKEDDLDGAKYVLVTNEHNVDLSFTPAKYPFLEVIGEFRETLYGREFFTIIAKVKAK